MNRPSRPGAISPLRAVAARPAAVAKQGRLVRVIAGLLMLQIGLEFTVLQLGLGNWFSLLVLLIIGGFVLSLHLLLALWTSQQGGHLLPRICVGLLAILFLTFVYCASLGFETDPRRWPNVEDDSPLAAMLQVVLRQFVQVAPAWIALTLLVGGTRIVFGWEVRWIDEAASRPAQRRVQFRLGQLLFVSCIVAILLAALRSVGDPQQALGRLAVATPRYLAYYLLALPIVWTMLLPVARPMWVVAAVGGTLFGRQWIQSFAPGQLWLAEPLMAPTNISMAFDINYALTILGMSAIVRRYGLRVVPQIPAPQVGAPE